MRNARIALHGGLLVNALVAGGYAVYPVNPRVAARYRERDSVAGVKSDRRDAEVLANLVRTDRHKHRQLVGDSEPAQEIRARARAHLRAVRTLVRLRNQLRSLLLEFYPAAAAQLLATDELGDGLAVLAEAPDPVRGRRRSLSKLESALRRQGRQRNLARRALAMEQLRVPHLELGSPPLMAAYRDEVASLVRLLIQACAEVAGLAAQLATAFRGHRRPRSTAAFQDWQTSSAPGFWASRATIRPAMQMLRHAAGMPATSRSRAPPASTGRCGAGWFATGASPTPRFWGPHQPSTVRLALVTSMTGCAGVASHTTRPSGSSPTNWSAASTPACVTTAPTTKLRVALSAQSAIRRLTFTPLGCTPQGEGDS